MTEAGSDYPPTPLDGPTDRSPVGNNNDDDDDAQPDRMDTTEPISPAVVFSCRHLYHRDCLVAIGGPSRSASRGQPAYFTSDGSAWEPSCPVCT